MQQDADALSQGPVAASAPHHFTSQLARTRSSYYQIASCNYFELLTACATRWAPPYTGFEFASLSSTYLPLLTRFLFPAQVSTNIPGIRPAQRRAALFPPPCPPTLAVTLPHSLPPPPQGLRVDRSSRPCLKGSETCGAPLPQ